MKVKKNKPITIVLLALCLWLPGFLVAQPVNDTSSFKPSADFLVNFQVNYPSLVRYPDTYVRNVGPGLYFQGMYHFSPRWAVGQAFGVNMVYYSRNALDSLQLFTQKVRETYLSFPTRVYFKPESNNENWIIYGGVSSSVLVEKWVNLYDVDVNGRMVSDPSKPGRFDVGLQAGSWLKLSPRFFVGAELDFSLTSNQERAFQTGRFSVASIMLGAQLNPERKPEPVVNPVPTLRDSLERKALNNKYILLVRLKTESRKLATLKSLGLNEEVKSVQEKVIQENQLVAEAFASAFTTCPVYFFYDTSSQQILNLQYNSCLMNDSLNRTKVSFEPGNTTIYIAEFGSPYSEAFQTSSGYGLVVYSHLFEQLQDPFPYFTNNFFGVLGKMDVVKKFDKNLKAYLGKKT